MGVKETSLYYLQSRYYNPKTGRFLNADAFTATGQGLLGNNMFLYCCNNPVFYCDSSGTRAVPAYRAEMGGGKKDVIATSDHLEESDQLLNEMVEQLSDMTQYGTVHISVQYIGVYKEPESNTMQKWIANLLLLAAGEGIPVLAFVYPPLAPVAAAASTGIRIINGYLILENLGETLHPGLPGGAEYRQYKVIASWSEVHNYSGGIEVGHNQYEFYYVRDNRILNDPQWYLQAAVPVYP